MNLTLTDHVTTVTYKTQHKKALCFQSKCFFSVTQTEILYLKKVISNDLFKARAKNSTGVQFCQPSSKSLHIDKKCEDGESAISQWYFSLL